MAMFNRSMLVWSVLSAVAACGCSDVGLEKVVVRGEVRYDGKPLPHGQIRFVPLEGTPGPVSGSVIQAGQYVAEGKGGVPVGRHRVEIRAYRPVSGSVPAAIQAEGGPTEQYLPGKYNGLSELTIEITADSGSQTVDFDLEP